MSEIISYFKENFSDIEFDQNNIVVSYSSVEAEIDSVKYGVGIYNRSESAVLELTGNDVLDFLQRISTNDVLNLESYHYVITLFTNEKGRLIDRALLLRVDDKFYLIGSKKNEVVLNRWLNKYIISEDVKIENLTSDHIILDIIGPQAESYLTLICGEEVNDLDNNKLHRIEIDNTNSYLLKKRAQSGENLYWIIAEMEESTALLDYLLSHKSVFDLSMIGETAFDYYRILNRVPKYPNEINDNYNPHETGLMSEVSMNKGCYIGQEVVARLDTYDKVQKKLKKVRIQGIEKISVPAKLYDKNNDLVGILTTSISAITNNHIEGLAFISRPYEGEKNLSEIKLSSIEEIISLKIID